jgi:hypothetical protein
MGLNITRGAQCHSCTGISSSYRSYYRVCAGGSCLKLRHADILRFGARVRPDFLIGPELGGCQAALSLHAKFLDFVTAKLTDRNRL